jgi:GAF domain-containing protein
MDIEYTKFDTKNECYQFIGRQVRLIGEETADITAILANVSALLKLELDRVNWAGFYLFKEGRLVLGPFQGKPAVAEIAVGKGVCGTAVQEERTQLVENVHTSCNHIACDAATSSEIVVPIFLNGRIFGVIDIDSPAISRFDDEDKLGLEGISEIISEIISQKIE